MSDDDTNVIDLSARRKRDMPVAQTGMRDVHDIVEELVETMKARGSKRLLASLTGGWLISVECSGDNGSLTQEKP